MQFHNQRERESRTNEDIDRERTHENYDLQNDENINYNERVKDIIDSQKTGTRKTRKDAVLVNELLVTRSEEHTSELQSRFDLVCRLLLEKKKQNHEHTPIARSHFDHNAVLAQTVDW